MWDIPSTRQEECNFPCIMTPERARAEAEIKRLKAENDRLVSALATSLLDEADEYDIVLRVANTQCQTNGYWSKDGALCGIDAECEVCDSRRLVMRLEHDDDEAA